MKYRSMNSSDKEQSVAKLTMDELRALREPVVHLLRGSKCVRRWSKYKRTDSRWSLCGVMHPNPAQVTDHIEDCNCEFCLQLTR